VVWLPSCEKFEDITLFDRLDTCDGQTDIAQHHRPHLCIASRGKNQLSKCCQLLLVGQKSRAKRTPAKPARATSMWRASLILQKSREAMAMKEMDVDETSRSSVLKTAEDAVTEQVTTSGWQRKCIVF